VETWPSGRRHFPAKEAYGLKPVSRVRISPSPPEISKSPRKRAFFRAERAMSLRTSRERFEGLGLQAKQRPAACRRTLRLRQKYPKARAPAY
jgi:hypothetical protein